MKKVLSLLMAFVFVQTQCWALSGGPRYGGNQAAVSGTYAGVFTGISGSAVQLNLGPLIDATGSNATGLFVIGVPITDVASGTMAIFFEGTFFQGGILGVADPNKQTFTGVAQGIHISQLTTFNDLFFGTSSKSVSFDATADGTIKAKIQAGGSLALELVGTGNFTVSRIVSQLVTFPDPNNPGFFITRVLQTSVPEGTLSFTVDGFKQSNTVTKPAADSIASLLNGQGTNPNGG